MDPAARRLVERMALSEFAGGYTETFAKNLLDAVREYLDKVSDKPWSSRSVPSRGKPQQQISIGEPETGCEAVLQSDRQAGRSAIAQTGRNAEGSNEKFLDARCLARDRGDTGSHSGENGFDEYEAHPASTFDLKRRQMDQSETLPFLPRPRLGEGGVAPPIRPTRAPNLPIPSGPPRALGPRGRGRPPGSRNRSTIFRERMALERVTEGDEEEDEPRFPQKKRVRV